MSNKKPLFAFFGTPEFVTHALDALESRGLVPALVITAPDKPRGRHHELSPTPVKAWALERGIDVLTPPTLKDEQLMAELRNTDWDFFLVAAYAKFLSNTMLAIPRLGSLNIHPSLLPKYRGPSPFISAILADDRHTGVSIMQMGEVMDGGPIVAQATVEIEEADPDDTGAGWPLRSSVLSELLFTEGGNLLAETLPFLMQGEITPEVQDESKATFTKKFTDADALVDLQDDPRQNYLKIKAFDTGPRAYMMVNNKRVIITDAEFRDEQLKITRVIPEGKKEMDYESFLRGQH